MPELLQAKCVTRSGAHTSIGALRMSNEDSYYVGRSIFLVADGMGGHAGGKAASEAVVAAFRKLSWHEWLDPAEIKKCVVTACENIVEIPRHNRMPAGSTLVGGALILDKGIPTWLLFNVGDSRAYLYRNNKLAQISVDHSRVQQIIDAGTDPAIAEQQVKRNVITRALGVGRSTAPEIDLWSLPVMAGDRLLLCSDGLNREIADDVLQRKLASCSHPSLVVADLVDAAVRAGGRDNVTAVLIDALEVRAGRDPLSQPDAHDTVPEDVW